MRRNVHVKMIGKRHKNPQTLEELQAVRQESMWTCERYMLANERWIQAATDMVCGLDVCDELDENSFSDTYVNDREGDNVDEVTGVTLFRCVTKALAEEMKWHEKFQAFEEVTDETCVLRTGRKPISFRWRDVNKGDSERVEVGSRLVAREIQQKGSDSNFAGTPPLALVRHVMSRAATLKNGKETTTHCF